MSLSLQTLATGLASLAGDVERLIVQYPAEATGNVGTTTLNKLLIPRQRNEGFNAQLYSLTPPTGENTEQAIELFNRRNSPTGFVQLISQKIQYGGTFHRGYDTGLYNSMQIPEVGESVLRGFGSLVEQSLGIPPIFQSSSARTFPADAINDFISSTFLALAQCAEGFQYEAWNSGDDLESSSLSQKLETLAEKFPITPLNLQSTSHDAPPSNVRHRSEDRNLTQNEARLALYKLTLSRLLILLYGRESTPGTDVRIWELVGQLLALTFENDLKTQFAIKVGLFVLKGSLDCLIPGSAPAATSTAGGGGNPGSPGAAGSSLSPLSPQFSWKRAAAFAGLCTAAVAPIVVLGPLAAVLGFGSLGPVAGGIAAGWQGAVGLIEAGGLFAMLQGIGMAGAASAAGAPLLATVSAAAGSGAVVVGKGFLSGSSQDVATPGGAFEFIVRVVLFSLEAGVV